MPVRHVVPLDRGMSAPTQLKLATRVDSGLYGRLPSLMHRGHTLATIPVALLHKNTLPSWGATRTRSVNDLPESTMCRVSEPVRLLAAVRHSTLRHPLAKRVFGRILQLLLIRSIVHDGNISWELAGEPHSVPLLITRANIDRRDIGCSIFSDKPLPGE